MPDVILIAQVLGSILTPVAAITGMVLGFLNRGTIKATSGAVLEVKQATNGLLEKRVAAAHDEGRVAERTDQRAGLVALPPTPQVTKVAAEIIATAVVEKIAEGKT